MPMNEAAPFPAAPDGQLAALVRAGVREAVFPGAAWAMGTVGL